MLLRDMKLVNRVPRSIVGGFSMLDLSMQMQPEMLVEKLSIVDVRGKNDR